MIEVIYGHPYSTTFWLCMILLTISEVSQNIGGKK